MTADTTEDFGSAAQRALLRRGRLTYEITARDPRFTYYGRTVGLVSPDQGTFDELAALARLQGNSNFARVPNADMASLMDTAKARAFAPVRYARWAGAQGALHMASEIVARDPLPEGLRIARLGTETTPQTRRSFGRMALGCGVLPPSAGLLAGQVKPGLTLLAVTAGGRVVSCAAAVAFLNDRHPDAGLECWWGMLATDPEWRGQRLSLILGARVIREMADGHGFCRFFTGVEPGNAPSEAVCTRLGLKNTDLSILGIADTSLVPGGRMTK